MPSKTKYQRGTEAAQAVLAEIERFQEEAVQKLSKEESHLEVIRTVNASKNERDKAAQKLLDAIDSLGDIIALKPELQQVAAEAKATLERGVELEAEKDQRVITEAVAKIDGIALTDPERNVAEAVKDRIRQKQRMAAMARKKEELEAEKARKAERAQLIEKAKDGLGESYGKSKSLADKIAGGAEIKSQHGKVLHGMLGLMRQKLERELNGHDIGMVAAEYTANLAARKVGLDDEQAIKELVAETIKQRDEFQQRRRGEVSEQQMQRKRSVKIRNGFGEADLAKVREHEAKLIQLAERANINVDGEFYPSQKGARFTGTINGKSYTAQIVDRRFCDRVVA
ncbi:hypothetical protein ACFLWA_03755 [Chloroflexota bacterium]